MFSKREAEGERGGQRPRIMMRPRLKADGETGCQGSWCQPEAEGRWRDLRPRTESEGEPEGKREDRRPRMRPKAKKPKPEDDGRERGQRSRIRLRARLEAKGEKKSQTRRGKCRIRQRNRETG